MNVILISHAIYDAETSSYNLVGKGSFAKRGGFISEVDQAIFIEKKNGKRIVHNKSIKFPARSTLSDIEDSVPMDNYVLADHMAQLSKLHDDVAEFIL